MQLSPWRRLHLSLLLQGLRGKDLLQADLSIRTHSDLLYEITAVEEMLREPQPLQGGGTCYAIAGYAFVVCAFLTLGATMAMVPGAFESLAALTGGQ